MSWLEDLHNERVFHYSCGEEALSGTLNELSTLAGSSLRGEPGESFSLNGNLFTYCGFDPVKVAQLSMIEYEKNGRKAYHIKDSSGKHRYIAKSKFDYLKHGEINGKKVQKRGGTATPLKGDSV